VVKEGKRGEKLVAGKQKREEKEEQEGKRGEKLVAGKQKREEKEEGKRKGGMGENPPKEDGVENINYQLQKTQRIFSKTILNVAIYTKYI